MNEDQSWWYCLTHQTVEHGAGCPNKERLGPFATKDEAAHALDTVRRRNQEWDKADED
jgi:hypothetical protein